MPFSSTADQWQKCLLRADLRPGPAVVHDFCRTLFCPEAVLFCLQQRCATARPASVSSTASCRFGARGYAASRHPPDDGRTRAGLALDRGFPASLQHPFQVPRQHGPGRFSSSAASTISTLRCSGEVGGSGSLPVILRPDEVSEARKSASMSSCLFMAFIEA